MKLLRHIKEKTVSFFGKIRQLFSQGKASKRKLVYLILICLFSLLFVGSSIYLICYFINAGRDTHQYDSLANIVASIRQDLATDSSQDNPNVSNATVQTQAQEDNSLILPEYRALYEANSDLVGWIQIPDTRVDYPVVQSPYEPDYYLYRNFHKENSQSGCIYVREACDVFTPSDNVVIYGHRMNSGIMFADLMNYRKKSFWEAHQTLTFDTIYQRHTYQIICVFITSGDSGVGYPYHRFNNAASETEFNDFIQTIHSLQLYKTGHTAQYGDMLITLSTCLPRYEKPANGRLVVVAKRIS